MREIKKRYWMTPLAVILIFGFVLFEGYGFLFRRSLDAFFDQLDRAVGKQPGIALDKELR